MNICSIYLLMYMSDVYYIIKIYRYYTINANKYINYTFIDSHTLFNICNIEDRMYPLNINYNI